MSAAEFGSWFWSMLYDDVLSTNMLSLMGLLNLLAALLESNTARNSQKVTQYDVS